MMSVKSEDYCYRNIYLKLINMYTLSIDPGFNYVAYSKLNNSLILDIGIKEFNKNDFYNSIREYIEEIKNTNFDLISFEN